MSRTQGSLQYLALFLLVSPFLVGQVSAVRKCYECNSDSEQSCISDSQIETFRKVDCAPPKGFINTTNDPKIPVEFQCITLKGFALNDGRTVYDRRCVQKFMTCETIKNIASSSSHLVTNLKNPIQVEDCKPCDSDYCNSSGHLKVGILSIVFSLIAVYFFKF